MAKPILVIRCHHELDTNEVRNMFEGKMPDYHIIFVHKFELNDPEFEVYNVDKEPEIDYEELKRLINDRA